MGSSRLQWLDAFRGLAAIVVVVYHLNAAFGLPRIEFGFLAVALFFVLSGIVLGRRYEAAIRGGMTFGAFAWVRMRRLYPMVLIALSLMLVALSAGLPSRPYATFTGGTLLSVLTLAPYPTALGAGTAFPADPALWSLSAELLANALWFGLLKFGRRAAFLGGAVAMAVFLALAARHGNLDIGARSGITEHMAGWSAALGWFTVGYAISIYRPRLRVPNWSLGLAFAASCGLCQWGQAPALIADLLVVLSGSALLVGLMHTEPANPSIGRLCSWLGMLSYPLYLVHLPASRLAEWAVSRGAPPVLTHVLIVAGIAVAATIANEWTVRRLPISLRRPGPLLAAT